MELIIGSLKIMIDIPMRSLIMLFLLVVFTIVSYVIMIRLRRSRVTKFANYATLKRVHGYKVWFPHPSILFIKIVVVVLLFLIATESLQISLVKKVSNADFVIVLDTSLSMLIPDYEPNRIEFAKNISMKFSEVMKESKIGIVKFSEKAVPLTKLTNNIFEVEKAIKSVGVDLTSPGSAIGDAVALACSMLSQSEREKRIVILITDGKTNIGRNVSEALEDCIEANVTIFSIGIVPTEKTKQMFSRLEEIMKDLNYSEAISYPIPDENELKTIADKTNGEVFSVKDEKMFESVISKISFEEKKVILNSDYYILLFISFFLIVELMLYARLGAL